MSLRALGVFLIKEGALSCLWRMTPVHLMKSLPERV